MSSPDGKRAPATTRRRFLVGAGGSVLALPFVRGTLGQVARAQDGEFPLRFFVMFTGNGQLPEHWLPEGGESDFTLSPVLESLLPLQQKLLLAHGMVGQNGHSGGMSETLTARPAPVDGDGVATGGPSIDQLFADTWRGETPLASLELGVMPANEPNDQTFYSANGLPVPALGNPVGVFDKLTGAANLDPDQAALLRERQGSVLDSVAADLEGLQGRLSVSARTLLDAHLTLVRAREMELTNPPEPVSCDFPGFPDVSERLDVVWKAQHDNAITALRCGITRVVGLRAGGWGGIESGGYDTIGIGAAHHDAAHGGSANPYEDLLAINRFHAEQFAYLGQALDAIPEDDGTLLDHTVLLWVNEFGLGDFNHHSRRDVHITLLGGSRAGFKNGSYVQLADADYHDFLFTVAHALGRTDLASFGDRGTQILSELMV